MSYKLKGRAEKAHNDGIWSVCWTKSNLIVTGSVDESVKVWNPDDLTQPKYHLKGHDLAVVSVAANADGKQAAASSMDGAIW